MPRFVGELDDPETVSAPRLAGEFVESSVRSAARVDGLQRLLELLVVVVLEDEGALLLCSDCHSDENRHRKNPEPKVSVHL